MVSIIYGGSGTKYAQEMNDLIRRRSEERRYPITSKIVMESVLTGDLLASITDLFTQTEYCLAFLTADDCCIRGEEQVYRLRQNVALVETLLMEPAEDSGVTNPLALTVYYDYLGLLNLLLYELKKDPQRLTEATRCFQLVIDCYADDTDLGLKIRSGFVKYNLARCYLLQYGLWGNPDDATRAQKHFTGAALIRKGWLKQSHFHQVIRSALSYEYFVCKIDEINARCMLQQKSAEEAAQEYLLLERELETYMLKSEQLERPVFIQNLPEERRQGGNSGPMSEDML